MEIYGPIRITVHVHKFKIEKVQATWTVGSPKSLFALPLLFVKAIPELLIAREAGSCLEGTYLKATKAEFVITVRACWTYAIYSTHLFMLAEI